MATVDTNVLVRVLTEDDKAQADAAVTRLMQEADTGALVFVPLTVTIELEWVLRTQYQFSRSEIVRALISLLETEELEFQDEASVELALHLFDESSVEFADCLHASVGTMAGRGPLLTFDRKASKLSDAEMIGGDPKRA